MTGAVEIEEDEMLIFALKEDVSALSCENKVTGNTAEEPEMAGGDAGLSEPSGAVIRFDTLEFRAFVPDSPAEKSFLRSGFEKTGRQIRLGKLRPWKELSPELLHFSGMGIYRGTVMLPRRKEGYSYILELGEVSDTFTVSVNGREAPFPDQVMKRADITRLLREGENKLEIVVVSNLYNCLFHKNMDSFGISIPYLPREYGIWESDGRSMEIRCRKEVE